MTLTHCYLEVHHPQSPHTLPPGGSAWTTPGEHAHLLSTVTSYDNTVNNNESRWWPIVDTRVGQLPWRDNNETSGWDVQFDVVYLYICHFLINTINIITITSNNKVNNISSVIL